MHELAVCQALLTEVERAAGQAGAAAVRRVLVRIGALSGVEPQLLARACGAEHEVPPNRLLCPACGSWRTALRAGDELVLQRVEFTAARAAA